MSKVDSIFYSLEEERNIIEYDEYDRLLDEENKVISEPAIEINYEDADGLEKTFLFNFNENDCMETLSFHFIDAILSLTKKGCIDVLNNIDLSFKIYSDDTRKKLQAILIVNNYECNDYFYNQFIDNPIFRDKALKYIKKGYSYEIVSSLCRIEGFDVCDEYKELLYNKGINVYLRGAICLAIKHNVDIKSMLKKPPRLIKEYVINVHECRLNLNEYLFDNYGFESILLNKHQELEVIRGIIDKLNIDKYLSVMYNHLQMKEIRLGLKSNLRVDFYLNHRFSSEQMSLIRKGLRHKLPVELYNDYTMSEKDMENMYKELKNKNFIFTK
ncbi:MAG: hypothetical protein R3Y64_08290 [Peptostreptococcaceae bacterium]